MSFDPVGLYADAPGTITTWSGLRVDPLAMRPEDVSIEDVAHSLARTCRYNGHVGGFLSVARHSIWVSDVLRSRGDEMALWGLLHDASEAYLGDLVRPLKHSDELHVFQEAEERLDAVIAEAFGLPFPMPAEVHDADGIVLLHRELRDARHDWRSTPEDDERAFLARYAALRHGVPEPRPPLVIGLHGAKRVGKDTAGAVLVEHAGFERLSFAARLYATLLATDPMVPVPTGRAGLTFVVYRRLSDVVAERGWERAKDEVPEVRRLLERLGTEGVRVNVGESTWIDAALQDVKPGGRYVITDVRMENEAEAIHALGGEVWRITRPGFEPDGSHLSNSGLPDEMVDRTIVNDGGRAALRAKVLSIFTD